MSSPREAELISELAKRKTELTSELENRKSSRGIFSGINPEESKIPSYSQLGNASVDMILGAGDTLKNQMAFLGKLLPNPFSLPEYKGKSLIPSLNMSPSSEGKDYESGELLADVAPFFPGKSQVSAIESLLNATPKLINPVKNLGSKVVDYFSPQKHGEELLQKLGGGAPNLEANAKNVSKEIMKTHDAAEEEAKSFYNFVDKEVGNKKIYTKPDPIMTTEVDKALDMFGELKGLGVGKLQKKFENNPTFDNAHKLQSELGNWINNLKNVPKKTNEEKLLFDNLNAVNKKLEEDISSFLIKHDETANIPLKPKYDKATELYRENVSHYFSDPKLLDIVRGRETNIENIHDIFKYPTSKDEGVSRVIRDLSNSAKNKILFSKIKGMESIKNPKEIFESLLKAQNEGFSQFVTPEMIESVTKGLEKVRNKKYLTKYVPRTAAVIAGEEYLRNR